MFVGGFKRRYWRPRCLQVDLRDVTGDHAVCRWIKETLLATALFVDGFKRRYFRSRCL